MTYSDADIHVALYRDPNECDNWIRVTPYDRSRLQPASIDLSLGTSFVQFRAAEFVDMRDRIVPGYPIDIGTGRDSYYELKPGQFLLGATAESVSLGHKIWGKIEGKSSIGRMGLAVHVTAGFVDPGFQGELTLELHNISASPIRLRPGLPICQIAFGECTSRCNRPYGHVELGSRYQHQQGATPVRP